MIETRGVEFGKAWALPLYLLCGHIQYDRHFDEITISAINIAPTVYMLLHILV
jgi:hypothetical protein